jgi:hypothetical protein
MRAMLDQDPRLFPDPAAAPSEAARLHALAAASQRAFGPAATALDEEIVAAFIPLLASGRGEQLARIFSTAPSVAVHRHLWRLLVNCEQRAVDAGQLRVTLFALPVIIVAGIEGAQPAEATLGGVLEDAGALREIMREQGALAGNESFALGNALVAAGAIDIAHLPEILQWRSLPEFATAVRALEPTPIVLARGPESVHLRFLVGSAITAAGTDLLADSVVGRWGMPLAQALGQQLAAPGVSVLALPRAPQSLLRAVRDGRAAQREVGAQIFASNAIRKLRAAVGEPTAVISAHRSALAPDGGEIRLSLSSPFDPREAEGFRCPLHTLDRVADVVAMLTDLLRECRVTDVRIVAGVHPDRDPVTGLPLLFKGDNAPASSTAFH